MLLTISNLSIEDSGRISMHVLSDDFDQELWFDVGPGISPHSDLIAGAVACTFGEYFDEYQLDFPITQQAQVRLSTATKAKWTAPRNLDKPPAGGKNTVLNFSGGFDSLAALALLGDSAKLVALDFGEKFERETNFFQNFETNVVKTNCRDISKSWTFMAVGSVLLREHLEADYIAFGTILEASPWNFIKRAGGQKTHALFAAVGYTSFNPALGLSEFGSALLAARSFPHQISDSLISLAEPHTEKYLRKTMLVSALNLHAGTDISLPLQEPTLKAPVVYGKSFAADFLAPGFIGYGRKEDVDRWISIPIGLYDQFVRIDPTFFWRDCTNCYSEVPPEVEAPVAAKKIELGIRPYQAEDWDAFHAVMEIVGMFHKFPSRRF